MHLSQTFLFFACRHWSRSVVSNWNIPIILFHSLMISVWQALHVRWLWLNFAVTLMLIAKKNPQKGMTWFPEKSDPFQKRVIWEISHSVGLVYHFGGWPIVRGKMLTESKLKKRRKNKKKTKKPPPVYRMLSERQMRKVKKVLGVLASFHARQDQDLRQL